MPSVQMAYLAAILANKGHQVLWSQGKVVPADTTLILSSLVDYKRETAWADQARSNGSLVGFVGLTASKLPELFDDHADFVIMGEPEPAVADLADYRPLARRCTVEPVADLDSLPFPRWDLLEDGREKWMRKLLGQGKPGKRLQLLASRSCPLHCTYCPHRILTAYRSRSVQNVVEELSELVRLYPYPCVVFRDPLFSESRDRCIHLSEEIQRRNLRIEFECETRLDRLDPELLEIMHRSGLRRITFGLESVSSESLRKAGRRPIPEPHQREIIGVCRRLGIETTAFCVFGFLQDTWDTICATIDFAVSLGSTYAQFKILTPYPGTPMAKQMAPLIYEKDWEKFDGFTPTFQHPNLTAEELRFLLGAAYSRFYLRPSFLSSVWKLDRSGVGGWFDSLDQKVARRQTRLELETIGRSAEC